MTDILSFIHKLISPFIVHDWTFVQILRTPIEKDTISLCTYEDTPPECDIEYKEFYLSNKRCGVENQVSFFLTQDEKYTHLIRMQTEDMLLELLKIEEVQNIIYNAIHKPDKYTCRIAYDKNVHSWYVTYKITAYEYRRIK